MVGIVSAAPRRRRFPRRPEHTWNIKVPPLCLQLTTMAPVLPGETLDNALMQVRAVTDPITSPIIGWWLEHYLFYVPVSGLSTAEAVKEMFLNPSTSLAASITQSATGYTGDDVATSKYNWYTYCYNAIINAYFRDRLGLDASTGSELVVSDSDSDWSGGSWSKVPVRPPGWLDSASLTAEYAALDVTIANTGTASDDILASEIETAMRTYEMLKQGGLTNQTYEEFLATYGVKVPETAEDKKIPELLRVVKSWQYPSNTINSSTGAAVSAVSWAVAERVDKKRYFKEPGFLCWGVCARPKVYFQKQTSGAFAAMTEVLQWLPGTLSGDSRIGFKNLPVDVIAKDITGGIWVDFKDLFLHGDQFLNYAPAAVTDANMVPLPEAGSTSGVNTQYVSDTAIKAFFVTPASAYYVKMDGVCNFTIAGNQLETSPGTVAQHGYVG